MSDETQNKVSDADSKLLKQIRDDYRYCLDYWREIREQASKDMEFVAGHSFSDAERMEREDLGAPVVEPDEISQYLNQAINNLRQNKRAIKVNPKGSGATDQDAELRAAIIRGIEYQSNAQAAYTTGFEGAINCSFGAWRINLDYISSDGYEVTPRIKRIPNAHTVLFDPDAKEADRSDQKLCFVTDTIRKSDFERRYPNAKKTSFTAQDVTDAPDWIKGEKLVIAEAWKVETSKRKKMQVQRSHEKEPSEIYEDELGKGEEPQVLNERVFEESKVVQRITNGVEILETNKWIGSWIPIIGVFGKEIYRTEGGISKLEIQSLVRLARDPQKMLAFVASQEAEEFGMAPRAPVMGYKGQFASDWDAWVALNKVRRPFVQVDPVVDESNGQILPLPTRPQFQPNIDAYQVSRESWRRAVQSAMGIMPLPTQAQRKNEKSGVALQQIQQQEQVGSFHFTDNFDRALENTGRQLNELITKVMDTPRHVGVRNPDDSHSLLQVLTEEQFEQLKANGQIKPDIDYLISDRGEFDVTISTGPSFQSQRDEASQFVDLLMSEMGNLPISPAQKTAIMSKAIKLKNIGPIGDEIAKILDPQGDEEPIPPQAQQAIQQAKMEAQAINAHAQQVEAELQKLQMEKQAKTVEMNAKVQMHAQEMALKNREADIEELKLINARAIAEIQTKAQDSRERVKLDADLDKELHVSSHERAMQAEQQQHEKEMASQEHAQALEQQDAGHEQALEQQDQAGQQQADLQAQSAEQQASAGPA